MQTVSGDANRRAAMVLNRAKLDELRRAHEIKTEKALADFIGVATETLWRVSNGGVPSSAFMAKVKVAFPSVPLDALFTVRFEDAA